jgi:ribosomal protein S18 acetylase RimI-like enzyme
MTPTQAPVFIRTADLSNNADGAAVVAILDSYASDPIGGGQGLAEDVKTRLIPALHAHPTSMALLAFEGTQAVGVTVGFFGLSTFRARPLLNIHDLAVLPAYRGRGIGTQLLHAAEAIARSRDCCVLTLEVLQENQRALQLYERYGFGNPAYANHKLTRYLTKPLT